MASPSPSWVEAVLLVLFTLLVLLFAAERAPGAELDVALPAGNADRADTAAIAGREELGAPVALERARGGQLLLRSAHPGLYLPAPTVDTDVLIRVTGMIDRTRVRQRFHNPTSVWVEGVYVFPLPTGAAVDTLRVKIGERLVEGVIQERAEAKRTYEAAKAAGSKASLVEQERPNLFTTSIANLGPGEDLEVEIEYQEELRYDDGRFELRFPMVVAPRYIPGAGAQPDARSPQTGSAAGWSPNTAAVPDAARITPPVAAAPRGRRNPVHLRVDLDAGFKLANLSSPSHRLATQPGGLTKVIVQLADDQVPADRDFVLEWAVAPSPEARAAVFTEHRPEGEYALLMLVPPVGPEPAATLTREPREVIFVIDTSGSMAGGSLAQAKQSLRFALQALQPEDRFNVIQFNSGAWRLFDAPEMAFPDVLQKALAYVDGLEANGGTEMRLALEMALAEQESPRQGLRQVVFMTDGSVGNEDELFGYIRQHLGDSRLFTVGMGSAPNSHFLRQAAQFGRGTFTYVGSPKEESERMAALFHKLERPALTDIELTFGNGATNPEYSPAAVPDLYAGEPVTVAVRLARPGGSLTVRGVRAGVPWEQSLELVGEEHAGVEKLWARRKIAELADSVIEGRDALSVKGEVTAVALEHHLVSEFTSLVAVDVTPAAPNGEVPRTTMLPVDLPAGWQYEDVWGEMPQTATPRDLLALTALLSAALAWILRFGGRS